MCDCILVLIALIFPPLPVWIKCGICSAESLINICLCLLGYLPGVIHSFYIISKYPVHYILITDEEAQIYSPSEVRRYTRDSRTLPHHHHHNNNNNNNHTQAVVAHEQQPIARQDQNQGANGQNANYGAITEQPPPYTELQK